MVMSSVAMNTCVHTFVWAYIFDSLVCSEYLSLQIRDLQIFPFILWIVFSLFLRWRVEGGSGAGECSQHGMQDLNALARD